MVDRGEEDDYYEGATPMSTDSPAGRTVRYCCFGARHSLGQLPRIETGLLSIGAVPTDVDSPEVDLIYANDEPRWQEAIDYRDRVNPDAKLILCTLDIPELHYPTFNPYEWLPSLRRADAVVSISRFVQGQLVRLFGLPSTLIYQPIQNINPAKRVAGERPYPEIRALMCGRLGDSGKRADMAIRALILAGFSQEEVAMCGGQYPGWGRDMGVVDEATLNDLYNSADFLVDAAVFQGLGLPSLQAVCAGAIPIITSDQPTNHEFFAPHHLCFPHPHALGYRMKSLIGNPEWMKGERQWCLERSPSFREMFSGRSVAERILAVYSRLIAKVDVSVPTTL